MTKTKEELEEWDFSAVGKMPDGDILYSVSRELDNKIRAALTNAPEVVSCLWVYDETSDFFETACAHSFHFVEGKIKENGFVFCPYCANKIVREK